MAGFAWFAFGLLPRVIPKHGFQGFPLASGPQHRPGCEVSFLTHVIDRVRRAGSVLGQQIGKPVARAVHVVLELIPCAGLVLTMYPMLGSRMGVIRFQEVAELLPLPKACCWFASRQLPTACPLNRVVCWLEMDAMAPLRHSATRHQPPRVWRADWQIEILLPAGPCPYLVSSARRVPEFASPLGHGPVQGFRSWSNANLYAGEDAKDPGFCMRVFN